MGGQKCHWNGLVHCDLMKRGLEQDRRELAQDRSAWQRVVKTCVDAINKGAQQNEDKKWTRGEHNSRVSLLPWLGSFVHVLPLAIHSTPSYIMKVIRHVGVDRIFWTIKHANE